jgi:hypothetical protein
MVCRGASYRPTPFGGRPPLVRAAQFQAPFTGLVRRNGKGNYNGLKANDKQNQWPLARAARGVWRVKRHARSRRPIWWCRIWRRLVRGTPRQGASPVWGQRGAERTDGEDAPRVHGIAISPFYSIAKRPPAPDGRAGANSVPEPDRAGGARHYATRCAAGAGVCSSQQPKAENHRCRREQPVDVLLRELQAGKEVHVTVLSRPSQHRRRPRREAGGDRASHLALVCCRSRVRAITSGWQQFVAYSRALGIDPRPPSSSASVNRPSSHSGPNTTSPGRARP